jgi:hypothetical protein
MSRTFSRAPKASPSKDDVVSPSSRVLARLSVAPPSPILHDVLRSPGDPLDGGMQALMASSLAHDFSSVRVHGDARAAFSARLLGASAYTVGHDVVFGQGRFAPRALEGRRLLAHELAHVIQQTRHRDPRDRAAQLDSEAITAGLAISNGKDFRVYGGAPVELQAAPDANPKLPAAVVTVEPAFVFSDETFMKLDTTLKRFESVEEILEKRRVGDNWWYKIRYKTGKIERVGWSLGENFSEMADPSTFKFQTPGATGRMSPFEDLRKAVAEEQLEPKIARLINYMNVVVLPTTNLSLPDFVSKSFFLALVQAKGSYKQASLLMTASVRSFKSTSAGKFPWVQTKVGATSAFDPATFRDKLWHFFWNAYEILDDTSAWWLDFKGIGYELKSRSQPIREFFGQEPLSKDATEDILFNRGGAQFAKWAMENNKAIAKFYIGETEKLIRAVLAREPGMAKLSAPEQDKIVERTLNEEQTRVEIQKQCYAHVADYAGRHVQAVLETIKSIGK